LINVDEVDYGETRKRHFECEYGWILLHRHEVPMLKDVRKHQGLEEYGTA
jgi:hypothetical protein